MMMRLACIALLLLAVAIAQGRIVDNVFGWGENNSGEFGNNESSATPLHLFEEFKGLAVVKVESGIDFALFLTHDGDVYVTGKNSAGVSCDGNTAIEYATPTLLFTDAQDIAVDTSHAVYVFTDDTVRACGDVTAEFNLFNVTALGAFGSVSAAAGSQHGFVYGEWGFVAWGGNADGQLGLGFSSASEDPTFQTLGGNTTILQIAAGTSHSLILTDEGLLGVGSNAVGQLGVGATASLAVLTTLTNPVGVEFVAATNDNTLFLTTAATNNVWGTGENSDAQLSTGDRKTRFTPVRSNGGFVTEHVEFATLGDRSSGLITATRRLFMAGHNDEWQLGLGDRSLRANGVQVTGVPCAVVAMVSIGSSTFAMLHESSFPVPYSRTALSGGVLARSLQLNVERELLVDRPLVIPHVFTPAITASFLTVEYETTGPATLSSTVGRFGACDEDEVVITCSDIAQVTIEASSNGLTSDSLLSIPCHGTVELQGLQPIGLGSAVTALLVINPPAKEPINFEIATANHVIAIPSHTTVSFAAGQSSAAVTLASPANGKIGITSGFIAPSIANTYQHVSFSLAVTGLMTAQVDTACPAVNQPTTLRVNVDPQAPGQQEVVLVISDDVDAPETFAVLNGQRTGTVDVTPLDTGVINAEFSTTLYSAASLSFTALGSFESNFVDDVVAGTHVPVTITLVPTNANEVVVTVSASNVEIDSSIVVPAGAGSVTVDSTPLLAGSSSITLSASGFCDQTFSRTVTNGLDCDVNQVSNAAGTLCVACPLSQGSVCSNRGTCDYSLCRGQGSVCQCASSFFGSSCQYSVSDLDDTAFQLELSASFQTTTVFFVDATALSITAPSGIVNGTFSSLTNLLNGITFESNAEHLAGVGTPPTDGIATAYGFEVEATCEDNSAQPQFLKEIIVEFFLPTTFPQRTFEHLDIFRYDVATEAWVLATTELDSNLVERRLTFTTTTPGQAFGPVIAPQLQTEGRPVETTTGVTGFQPVNPPEPQFSPDIRPGEPDRTALSVSDSAGSVVLPSLVGSMILALLALF